MAVVTERVSLHHAAPEPVSVRLREPCGRDELAVTGVDTRAAVALLERLVEDPAAHPAALGARDRDCLLAALHRTLWGDRIVATLECPACAAPYDLSFALAGLQRQLAEAGEGCAVMAARELVDSDGRHWRLPTAEEELIAAERGRDAGVARLLAGITGTADADPLSSGARLERLAPLLDVDLEAPCSECGHAQLARFDLQSYVLQRLLDEREQVLAEVHALASGYGWSFAEIEALPRSLRQSLVRRVAGGAQAVF